MPIPLMTPRMPAERPMFETEGELHLFELPRPPQPWRRMLAFFIDFSLLHAVSLWLGRWTAIIMLRSLIPIESASAMGDGEFAGYYTYAILMAWPMYLLFLGFTYYTFSLSMWGTTIGKGLLGLEVVNPEIEDSPSVEAAAKRYLTSLINIMSWGVTFYLFAYKDDGRCLHDRASGTIVRRRMAKNDNRSSVVSSAESEVASSPEGLGYPASNMDSAA